MRYLSREKLLTKYLSHLIETPRKYRLSEIPRSISWDSVQQMLATIDRRTKIGKRDFAIVLLLITYGLRAHEIENLSLDDIDWKQERLRVPERKAGHSTAFPLSSVVGEAIIAYLKEARPKTQSRNLFIEVLAPYRPLSGAAVSSRISYYLHKTGISVHRAGSHTLRHTCVQRLVDANFPLKTIGDYITSVRHKRSH